MTSTLTHVTRLMGWGRTLASHGALRGIERDALTPPGVRRLIRLARLGARVPARPRYAEAFRAVGPAAVKLGQTLATRPDLVGPEATADLLQLQDALPPVPFATVAAAIEAGLGKPLSVLFASIEEEPVGSASIAQVHRAVTPDGRQVAVKVVRPGVAERFLSDIDTYEWAAARLERRGGELERLRPTRVVANLKRWTVSELDLRREAASASELAAAMEAVGDYRVPAIDWDRTSRSVLTMEWIDGTKVSRRNEIAAQGHDMAHLAQVVVTAFLRQAITDGFFHADLHQGNLFVTAQGQLAAIDFGIMGRIDPRARRWLAEILYGLIVGDYVRVAEIHFEAGYVPPHHSVAEFATALRAVGEPMRGKAVKEMSMGLMLDGLFAVTRDFDMQTQPHLLLLQKTMVMVEGVATGLDPDINMWEVAEPFVRDWLRTELGPEARAADALVTGARTLALVPELVRRLERYLPPESGAPPEPPTVPIEIVGTRLRGWATHGAVALAAAAVGAGLMALLG